MVSPNWNAYASVTLVVLVVLIALARASQAMFDGEADEEFDDGDEPGVTGRKRATVAETTATRNGGHVSDESEQDDRSSDGTPSLSESAIIAPEDESGESIDDGTNSKVEFATPADEFTPGTLLVNVALSQGLFGAILVVAAVLAAIPASALGVERVTLVQLGVGTLLGVALYVANELGQRVADAFGIEYEDGLRELLTPESLGGWFVLLALVLPIIAGFEELLFRSSLVGAFAAGFAISPWFLVVASSVAFAAGHGAQGPGGMLVTGTLGAVLASAFVLTGSLLVVVVAHYLVNALEFLVHAHDDRKPSP